MLMVFSEKPLLDLFVILLDQISCRLALSCVDLLVSRDQASPVRAPGGLSAQNASLT